MLGCPAGLVEVPADVLDALIEEWTRYIDVRPMERPWYQAARKHEPGVHAWTAPYTFLTTKEPGMSVSSRWSPRGSDTEYVMAFNITLTEISEYTTSLRPSANGMTVVFTQEGRYCIGLPPDPRFNESKAIYPEDTNG